MPDPILKPANEPQFLFEVSGTKFRVAEFSVTERISRPYRIDLTLASEDEIGFEDMVGQEGLLTVLGEEADREFHGVVRMFMQIDTRVDVKKEVRYYLYRAQVVPSLWLLSQERDCRIFQEMKTEDIVKKILGDAGITKFEFRLQGQYQPREYCVQYRETDLDFVSRLLEEEGIFYLFEHSPGAHLLVFGDGPVVYQPIAGKPEVTYHSAYHHTGATEPAEEYVSNFTFSKEIRTGKVTMRDFNFKKPSLDLTAQEAGDEYQRLESYDYPGEYKDPGEGKKYAKIRIEEERSFVERIEGRSKCARFLPGFTFTLADHDVDRFNAEYLLVEVVHEGAQPQVIEEYSSTDFSYHYANRFLSLPSSVTFRPERMTRKPVVEGPQTAIVVGPKGEEIYTDEHGRVKVQFHWDREGKKDEKSSCWIRVSQLWAGANWGAIFIPRIGHEVIVDFVEGDPDQPIITGRVYHGGNTPPYALPGDKNKSTIKSNSTIGGGGYNELRFDDSKTQEEIYLQAQKNWNTLVKNNRSTTIGANDTLTAGANRTKMVGANETNTVGMNRTSTVAAGNDVLSIGSNRVKNIGGTESVTIQGGAGSDESKKEDPGKAIAKGAAVGAAFGAGIMGGIGALAGAAAGAAIAAFKEATADKGSVSRNVTIIKGDDVLLLQEGSREATLVKGDDKLTLQEGLRKTTLVQGDDELTLADGSHTVNIDKGNSTVNSPKGLNKFNSKDIELMATNSILMQCGAGSISIDAAGNIKITGPKISINGTALIDIKAPLVKINS